MKINCVWEHNGNDSLLFAQDFPGAFTRGESLETAVRKMPAEIASYLKWSGQPLPKLYETIIVQQKESDLAISDADSDVLFEQERHRSLWRNTSILKHLHSNQQKIF